MYLSKIHSFCGKSSKRTVWKSRAGVGIERLGELNFDSSSLILADYYKRCEKKFQI